MGAFVLVNFPFGGRKAVSIVPIDTKYSLAIWRAKRTWFAFKREEKRIFFMDLNPSEFSVLRESITMPWIIRLSPKGISTRDPNGIEELKI